MRQFYRYGVHGNGIKKRARTTCFFSNKSPLSELSTKDALLAKELSRLWLEQNMQSYTYAVATITLVTENNGILTCEPYNENHNTVIEL